jgi:hypothetical protein
MICGHVLMIHYEKYDQQVYIQISVYTFIYNKQRNLLHDAATCCGHLQTGVEGYLIPNVRII